MNKSFIILLPLVMVGLTSCPTSENSSGSTSLTNEEPLKFISPAGAPALAFFNQGNNENYVTNSTPTNVAAELQKSEYDMVIFDSISGLNTIRNKELDFKLAQIITGGNFYLAGIDIKDEAMPNSESYVVSFGENLIPDLVWRSLVDDYWQIPNLETHYVNSNEEARAILASGMHNGNPVDYVFIAQPALFAVMNSPDASTYGRVSIIKNIRQEWKAYSGQDAIPQAGIFVRESVLTTKPNNLKTFFNDLDDRLLTAINNPQEVRDALNAYNSDLVAQQARFGFNGNIAYNVQKDQANGFGLVAPSETVDVNTFLAKINNPNYPAFSEDYFIEITR